MNDLINKVLSDPWVTALVTWGTRLFLLCLLVGLARIIYRLAVAPMIRFPYQPKDPEFGIRGWFQGWRERLNRVTLKPPWAEIELVSKIEEKREMKTALEEKDAKIKRLEEELEKHRELISEMKQKLVDQYDNSSQGGKI
jgi:hypothetical protein